MHLKQTSWNPQFVQPRPLISEPIARPPPLPSLPPLANFDVITSVRSLNIRRSSPALGLFHFFNMNTILKSSSTALRIASRSRFQASTLPNISWKNTYAMAHNVPKLNDPTLLKTNVAYVNGEWVKAKSGKTFEVHGMISSFTRFCQNTSR